MDNIEQRFHKKYQKCEKTGCWLWVSNFSKDGYGRLKFKGVTTLANRFSYALHNGAFKKDLLVCHSCDVPRCVNPNHLWLGTCAENHKDRDAKGRQAGMKKTHCPKGHEYAGQNLAIYIDKSLNKSRRCKECHRAANRTGERSVRKKYAV